MARRPPNGFVERLNREFGSGHDVRFNDVVQRWEVISPSAAGRPISQFFGWSRNPLTGTPIAPDQFGLLPFRELDQAGMDAIVQSMRDTFIGGSADGYTSWKERHAGVTAHNEAVSRAYSRQSAVEYAQALSEVDLRRPWIRHHSRNPVERRIAWGGTRYT